MIKAQSLFYAETKSFDLWISFCFLYLCTNDLLEDYFGVIIWYLLETNYFYFQWALEYLQKAIWKMYDVHINNSRVSICQK